MQLIERTGKPGCFEEKTTENGVSIGQSTREMDCVVHQINKCVYTDFGVHCTLGLGEIVFIFVNISSFNQLNARKLMKRHDATWIIVI